MEGNIGNKISRDERKAEEECQETEDAAVVS